MDCPNYGIYIKGIDHEDPIDQIKTIYLGCGMWSCPVCARKNAISLRLKIKRAVESIFEELCEDGFRPSYNIKFLTLTVPGTGYRTAYTPDEAEVHVKENFNRLRTALKKKYGEFEYIWVLEPQQDGYPHLHVLLMGKNIASIEIFRYIEHLWRVNYKMGFIKMNVVKGGMNSIIFYLAKYIAKGKRENKKNYRVYSMSKKLKKRQKPKNQRFTVIEYGRVVLDENGNEKLEAMWQIGEHCPPALEEFLQRQVDEIGDWFIEQSLKQKRGEQLCLDLKVL